MAERIIQQANIDFIERNLGAIHNDLQTIDSSVGTVNSNVKVVYDEIGSLAQEFHDFVQIQVRANAKQVAHTELVRVRQELESKYGHYDAVRRTTTGILQADDVGVVRKETISTATEEMMISTPGYWLAPCLVALAAWINNQPELAEKAIREAVKRDDEKTSLFWALVCRRADRKQACLKWTQRFLENQDAEDLDRNTIIVLDAYASGLLGADSEGVVSRQMTEWLEHLADKPGFVEQQSAQWSEAINSKRKPLKDSSYTYLKKYSETWPILKDIMEGACLHAEILAYFTNIFNQEASTDAVKVQLDGILTSLVTDFDDEELPLRREEKYNQFVIDFDGDVKRAQQNMAVENTAFETHKDFTQLLTDSAMKPESSHASVSTQKFAIALSRDWISAAYNDIVAQNRMKIPYEISINVDTFNDKTKDGQDEEAILQRFNELVDREKTTALEQAVMTSFDNFCLYGGGAIGAIGLFMMIGNPFLGLIAIIAGAGMLINHFSKKKQIENRRQVIEKKFEEKREKGSQIIRALLAEIVDFLAEFEEKDSESQKVVDYLESITPDQYVRKLADTGRRIKV